ncbi:Malonyl-[acyl-carrier protein] O-methyltransferase [Bienertia sinuspersici]
MAKMRPSEKLKVDFNINGQPIVKDPLNALLYEVEQFSHIPKETKDKMWHLVLKYRNFRARLKSEYYDTEETDEELLKEDNMPKFADKKDWECIINEYYYVFFPSHFPNFHLLEKKSQRNIKNLSCLDYGHTARSKSFVEKAEDMRDKVIPSLLDVYEETHLTSDKLPITEMENHALVSHLSILICHSYNIMRDLEF